MLEIKAIKNNLSSDENRSYCFRSTCSQTLSCDELVKEMAGYNSSFTEADNAGMLNVLKTIVVKYLAKGYNIELPFGTLRATVNGTCKSIQDGFVPGTGNNRLGFIFSPNADASKTINANLEYKQIAPDKANEAKIYRITAVQDDAKESDILDLSKGKILRLHGRNLSFDLEDEKQGVFIENEEGITRIATYTRRGSNIVDAIIPDSAKTGTYTAFIATKPGINYSTAYNNAAITVA
ncbi:MAG: DUF4469 domain-containing protein [Treponemataceae bacterium]|nr:DUF4469 domain-containing protein [Treponemataceae bacterium]